MVRNARAYLSSSILMIHLHRTDLRVSWLTLGKPIFPCICYARPFHMPFLGSDEKFPMASRLLTLMEMSAFLGPEMVESIYDLLELSQYTERVKSKLGYSQGYTEDVECYFNFEVLHVEYSFLNDRFTPSGQLKGDDTVEGCVRLACLLYHNTTIWGFFPHMASVFHSSILAFEAALQDTISTGQYILCPDLLVWLLTIAACAAQYVPERSRFVCELAVAISTLGLRDFEEYHSLLTGYFYVDRCYLAPCRGLWDEVQLLTEG
jgi:hypothetical protein